MNGLTPKEALELAHYPCSKQYFYRTLHSLRETIVEAEKEMSLSRAISTADMSPMRSTIANTRVPSVRNSWWKSQVTALRDENVRNG